MLSDHERETLLDIEHRLVAESPDWARTFDRTGRQGRRQRAFEWTAHIVAVLLAAAITMVMLAAHAPGPALFFAAVTGLSVWLVRRLRRPTTQPGIDRPGTDQPGAGVPPT